MYQLDDEMQRLNAGVTIFIPSKVKHAFNCTSEKPGTLLVAFTLGKGMENYFADKKHFLYILLELQLTIS